MNRRLLLALLACLPAALAAAPLRVFDQATTEALGQQLHAQERRVAIAADMVRDFYDADTEEIVGFVTTGKAPHLTVRFLRARGGELEPAVDAVFDSDLLIPGLEPATGKPLSAAELAQANARRRVAADVQTRCNGRYNTLVVDEPGGKHLLVYGIAVSDNPDQLMVGGHVRFTVSADGQQILKAEPLSSSCAVVGRDQFESAADSEGTRGIGMRNPLADRPLETHVLMSLMHGIPLFVMTADSKMWKVQNGKMKVVRNQPGEGQQ